MKDDCIFCKLANGVIPVASPYEDDMVKVIFDAAPASLGHALILTKEHYDNVYELDDEVAAHITVVAKKVALAMKMALKVDGINILQNNGEAAGQTVMHYHTHIIPRYNGDNINIGWQPGETPDADALATEVKKYL